MAEKPPPHKRPLISVEFVSKSYGENPLAYDQLVLRNVSFDIYDGEFVTLFGPSGSGKSSLLNLLAGLESPSAGRVMVRRRDLAHFDSNQLARYHRMRMGMVFQSFNNIKSLKVWENIALPQTANGVRYKLRRKRALRLLKLFGLEAYPDRLPNELSGGEQQRAAIARALVNNPYFLLVDEPTGNLDSKAAADVMQIFAELNKDGHTIVMVTHNPEQLAFASRILYVQDGQIVKEEYKDGKPHPKPRILQTEHPTELSQYIGDPDEHADQLRHTEVPISPPSNINSPSAIKPQPVTDLAKNMPNEQPSITSKPVINQSKPIESNLPKPTLPTNHEAT